MRIGQWIVVLALAGCGGDIGSADGGACDACSELHDGGAPPDLSASVDASVCPTANQCGASCCATGTVCLFDQCITPGKPCHTANDCGANSYCETALAALDGGTGVADAGAGCTQPIPLEGRCVTLPPVCPPDGGAAVDGGACIASCEYHSPANGKLSATPRWTWGPKATASPEFTDVWATPAVGRIYDSNCDGKVDELDPPDVVFVSGRAVDAAGAGTCCQCNGTTPTSCHTGVLRMLDGRTGAEVWTLVKPSPSSSGFAGSSVAIGDLDGDGHLDIAALSGEGFLVMVDATGKVVRQSDKPVPGNAADNFGWGGGLAIGDMDGDGFPEIAFGATVFTTTGGKLTLKFTGAGSVGSDGSGASTALSTLVDLDGDGHLELLAGATAYRADGTMLWNKPAIGDGFPAAADLDGDGKPEVILVLDGKMTILDGADGSTRIAPTAMGGSGHGGPPTVADFDGDGHPEIGVAQANFYSVMKPDFSKNALNLLWHTPNHDLSSSVTGSTVFDFEGDGAAEVIYNDECFLWVFSGKDGSVRFSAPTSSFTATEASLVADIDGDGRAEMLMIANGASPKGWGCLDANNKPTIVNGVTWTPGPAAGSAYRGITVWGDPAHSWVGTRTLWSEHTYHVSNICDDRDSACGPPDVYGSIPKVETPNWSLPWLNDFRQNTQDHGLFDAPDAVPALTVECSDPVVAHPAVRNLGLASLPAGVVIGVYLINGASETLLGKASTTQALLPGQTQELPLTIPMGAATHSSAFRARIIVDPQNPTFHECRDDNNATAIVTAVCLG